MIPTKTRETKRMKTVKLPKNLERAYKESNCRDCTVMVTRMDFAKILGKFTKVKIQYESSSTSKSKRNYNQVSPNTRYKSNENGLMRTYSNSHSTPKAGKKSKNVEIPISPTGNILKENNRLKRNIFSKSTNHEHLNNDIKFISSKIKHYGIVFENPLVKQNDVTSTISLEDLLPFVGNDILPSENWCIDYFPKNGEPKDDKVYDRIAAELEDLMFNEKNANAQAKEEKTDDFPSIMDILNDNPKEISNKNDQNVPENLESNDVEAMLLGKADLKQNKPTPMEIDNPEVSSFLTEVEPINNEQANSNQEENNKETQNSNPMDESPASPSILEENTHKESVPKADPDVTKETTSDDKESSDITTAAEVTTKIDENENTNADNKNNAPVTRTGITQVIFKKNINGTCQKSVICPKSMKYSICMLGKSVELMGAPKIISSLEDLQVLLQIVDESNLDSLYVLH